MKLGKFLLKYNIPRDTPTECPKCGSIMRPASHRGNPGMMFSSKACRKRVSAASTGLLEGFKLFPKQMLTLAYFWAHDCGGQR